MTEELSQEVKEPFLKSQVYRVPKERPYHLEAREIGTECALIKVYADDKEPKEEIKLTHHRAGITRAFETWTFFYDKSFGEKDVLESREIG